MSDNALSVEIRPATRPGAVKAYADVTLGLTDGTMVIHGCAVIQTEGKPPFVGMPSRPGTKSGKFFPVVEIEGTAHSRVVKAVLEKYASFNEHD